MDELVTDLMSEDVTTVEPTATIVEAALKMLERNVHELPVIGDDNESLGMVRAEDLLAATGDTISELVKPARLSVPKDISSYEAVERMNDSGSLYAVITDGKKFVGMVTWQDVLRAFKDH